MIKMRFKEITEEQCNKIRDTLPFLAVFETFTDMTATNSAGVPFPRLMTTWGIPASSFPLIRCDVENGKSTHRLAYFVEEEDDH